MSGDWKTLTDKEVQQLLSGETKKEPYKMVPHSFTVLNGTGKQYCHRCGLFAMKNKLSQWAIEKGCRYSDHPQWNKKVKKLTKRKWEQ